RARLPATACQRSARASCYGVRSQFWTRGRDTYSAWLQCQPSPSRPGRQTLQTYYFAHLQNRPHRGSPVARIRFTVLLYLRRFGAMASTNNSLAQMNKTQDVGKATKKRSVLRDAAEGEGPNS